MHHRVLIAVAVVLGGLALLTVIWHDWIEAIFGVDPDQGNGSFEWIVVAALAVGACVSALLALAARRRRVTGRVAAEHLAR